MSVTPNVVWDLTKHPYPFMLICGHRRSGKTTLLKKIVSPCMFQIKITPFLNLLMLSNRQEYDTVCMNHGIANHFESWIVLSSMPEYRHCPPRVTCYSFEEYDAFFEHLSRPRDCPIGLILEDPDLLICKALNDLFQTHCEQRVAIFMTSQYPSQDLKPLALRNVTHMLATTRKVYNKTKTSVPWADVQLLLPVITPRAQ